MEFEGLPRGASFAACSDRNFNTSIDLIRLISYNKVCLIKICEKGEVATWINQSGRKNLQTA